MPGITTKDFTPDELGRIAKVLSAYSLELAKFVEEMKVEGIERIPVKGVGELQRAEDRIGVFCDNTRTSMRRARRPKMFGEGQPGEEEMARPAKAKKKTARRTK